MHAPLGESVLSPAGQGDGYAGFEVLDRSGSIREVACMAHIRRKFVDIQQS